MNKFLIRNKKNVIAFGLVLVVLGAIFAYLKWGDEPEETIAGVLCGLGFGLTVIGLGIQKPRIV